MATDLKVLIADDDPALLKVMALRLRAEGFDVIPCSDAYQALESARVESPDVAVLDINMPAGGGPSAADRFQRMAKTQHIAIIFLTGDKSEEVKIMAKSLGAHDVLYKPVEIADLVSAIRSAWSSEPAS